MQNLGISLIIRENEKAITTAAITARTSAQKGQECILLVRLRVVTMLESYPFVGSVVVTTLGRVHLLATIMARLGIRPRIVGPLLVLSVKED